MGGVFGGKKKDKAPPQTQQPAQIQNGSNKNRITEQDQAILDVKARMTKIKTYVKKLELQEQETTDKIKQLIKDGQKQRAMIYLKQKKFQQKEIEKASGATMMLQQTLNNIESTIADAEIFKALKQGDSVIKELQAQVSIEDWEGLMDDHKENLALQKREQELFGKVLEDEDLLGELEALE